MSFSLSLSLSLSLSPLSLSPSLSFMCVGVCLCVFVCVFRPVEGTLVTIFPAIRQGGHGGQGDECRKLIFEGTGVQPRMMMLWA
jgi:hypothetical protein